MNCRNTKLESDNKYTYRDQLLGELAGLLQGLPLWGPRASLQLLTRSSELGEFVFGEVQAGGLGRSDASQH